MAGKKAADDDQPADPGPSIDLEKLAAGPALAHGGYAAAVARAMAAAAENAAERQQATADLAAAATAKSVRQILDEPEQPLSDPKSRKEP